MSNKSVLIFICFLLFVGPSKQILEENVDNATWNKVAVMVILQSRRVPGWAGENQETSQNVQD
jgi:hypothetical protein